MENKSSIQMSMEDYNKIKASIDSINRYNILKERLNSKLEVE